MIETVYRKYGIKVGEVWFSSQLTSNLKSDICIFHGIRKEQLSTSKDGIITKQFSWITDLTENSDLIFEKIRKNIKYQIKRAEKEYIQRKVFLPSQILSDIEILDTFESVYNQMYKDKGIKAKFNRKLVEKYIEDDEIVFTVAYLNDEPLVFHSYIKDNTNVRLFYSTSPFREQKDLANEIGRMNKALHWHDICYFKKEGIKIYDWGGISNPENPNGIDNFKMGFPGELISYNNVMLSKSILGKFILAMLKLKK